MRSITSILTILILLGCCSLYGQAQMDNYIPQEPNAQALARAIDFPVSHYTGLPNISIPLYDIEVDGLQIPISLSYHASGILANQEATSVGLGWTLNAGGMITRTVRGGDDFHSFQAEGSNYQYNFFELDDWDGHYLNTPYFAFRGGDSYPLLTADTEPDIYYYSLPTCSGKFFFTRDTTVVLLNRADNVRIKFLDSGKQFVIDDAFGNTYHFDKREECQYLTNRGRAYNTNSTNKDFDITAIQDIASNFTETAHYYSSWYLTDIITVHHDTITFNYEIEKIQSPLRETLSKETFLETYSSHNISPVLEPTHENHGANKSLTSGWRLLNIVWKDNILSFSHENREDICRYSTADSIPQRITGIKVINKDSRLIKDLRFQQSYFSDGSFHHHPHLFKRLRLDGITDILSDSCRYQFSYYGYALVPKNTHNTDYWGFPNGSQQLENYLCSVSYNGSQYLGGNKTPNLDKTLDGTLRSITHPTGGQTKFEYELNTYMEYEHVNDDNPTPEVTEDGYLETYQGAWCEEFCHLPEVAEDTIVITYQQDLHMNFGFCYGFENRDTPITDYSHDVAFSILKLHENGNKSFVWQREIPEEILTQEVFYKDTVISRIPEGTYIIKVQATMPDFECDLTYGFHKRVPLYARSPRQVNGGGLRIAKISGLKTVEYNYLGPVQTIKPITSYIRQAFYFNATVDDAYASANYLFQFSESIRPLSTIKNGNTFGYGQVTETISDGTNTTYNFHNDHENELELGFPLLPTVPDWYNGLIESKTVSSPQGASLRTDYEYEQRLAPKPMQGMVYQPHDIMHSYSYEVYYPFEVRRTETEQFQNITTYSHVVHTSYNENLLPISVKDIAGGEEYETITVYPTDDNANISMNENMLSCNMVAVPVETRQLRNQVLINGQRTEYMQTADNLIVPQYKYSFSSGLPLGYDTIFYSCYTPKGHPRQLNLHNSVQTILWDQSDTYPIAVLQNQPFSAGISADQPRLRESFPEAHITTSSYIPLVGVTDKVNPRGYKQTFTYDRAGRFNGSFYKDDSGTDCAVQSIRYHYSDAIDPQNYVSTTTYIEKDRSDSLMKVEFFDGFSRPTTTSVQGLTMDGSYLSSLVQYDANGRKSRSWLPISSDEASAIDSASMRSLSSSFYNDGAAYEDIAYDGLDRTTYTSTPGEAWLDKGSHIYYGTNGYQEVRSFKVENGQLHSHNYFQAGTLRKKTMRDDDGVEVSSFSNLADKVIMQQKQDQCTYFVYDAHDNLRLVLSPVASDSLSRNGNWPIATNTILNRYCYYYEYDQRNRCIKKKLPGCAPVIYEYDNANHLVSEQDGVLSAKRKKRHYRYDSFDRMTEQYLSSDNGQDNYTEIRQWYDGYNFLDSLSAYFSSDILDSLSYEGITNAKGLLTGKLQRTSDDSWFADIFFYDELGRIKRHQTLHDGRSIQSSKMEYNNIGDVKREQVTYNVINPGTNLTIDKTYQYYPQSQKLWHKNAVIHTQTGTDSVTQTFSYDCLGNLAHTDRDGDAADMDYQYDMVHGWLKQIDSQNGFQQKLHREEDAIISRFNGSISSMEWQMPGELVKRRYDYEYDGQNRLKKAVYSEPFFVGGGRDTLVDAFNPGTGTLLRLVPSASVASVSPTGISQMEESVNLPILPPIERPNTTTNKYGEEIQYDKNSNITHIRRYGARNDRTYGLIDDVEITYNGNQRDAATDNIANLTYVGASEFVRHGTGTYAYDRNGALCRDENRGIDSIEYDLLGNLKKILFTGDRSIEYVYSASGEKLREIHKRPRTYIRLQHASGGTISPDLNVFICDTTDYLGSLILRNGHPEMLRLDDGYVSFDSDTISGIHYYIQDYMGNNRMVVNGRTDSIEQVTHYYPYGGVIGDISTNESLQPYKFEGKELDRTFGLDNYDIEARQYFAMAPMWDRPDKLAHKYYGISPYVFCGGDPVNFGDYDGMKPDSLEAALMANHVYDGTGPLEGGWSCDHRVSHRNGLKYGIYSRLNPKTNKKEYSLVFAGSEDWTDWKTDIIQDLFNAANPLSQFSDAVTTTSLLKHERASGLEITNIGHSLGGALAQVATLKSGDAAITFNPAGVSKETLKGLNLDYTGQDITNYVARGDDNWGNHGEFAGALYSERTARMGETIYLNNISKNSTIISRHYISYIINALSKGRIIIK